MTQDIQVKSHALTHTGRRQNNEDAFCVLPRLGVYAVADGMGGYDGGEVASKLVVDTLATFFRRNASDDNVTWPFGLRPDLTLRENMVHVGVRMAHQAVCEGRVGRLKSMGSTLAMLLVDGHRGIIGHVGDSRVYRLRDGTVTQLTRDHSLYAEMQDKGAALPPKAQCPFANIITRALGFSEDGSPDLRTVTLRPGDVYLLCTDGLSEHITEERLAQVLGAHEPEAACAQLVQEAYDNGSRDNITAVAVRIE